MLEGWGEYVLAPVPFEREIHEREIHNSEDKERDRNGGQRVRAREGKERNDIKRNRQERDQENDKQRDRDRDKDRDRENETQRDVQSKGRLAYSSHPRWPWTSRRQCRHHSKS